MEDRRFTELDLRRMLSRATEYYRDVTAGRWVIVSRFRRTRWEILVEPDADAYLLVVITAYPVMQE